MKRTAKKPLPPVSCIAVVGREGGLVFLRVELNAGPIIIKHQVLDALEVADGIREAVAWAHEHRSPTVELGLPSGESLLLALDRATRIADELVCGASRATGVRA